ncbi:hypothetical protein M426DRAFT_16924 [Hypoxylon sp. CI-4A]|nr:hypothetical protein M426DRAFT_16924 [Hypoxylon sp. CI-4A]
MAPIPNDDDGGHYDAAPPLDGGASPADLGEGDNHFSPTGLEIGVITGVVVIVILTVVGVFVWRSRKNRGVKVLDSGSSVAPTIPNAASPKPNGGRAVDNPIPPPKEDRSTFHNADISSFDSRIVTVVSPSATSWSNWGTSRRAKHGQVEEHEIADRF